MLQSGRIPLALLLVAGLLAGSASAQCDIGVYGDVGGTYSYIWAPPAFQPFDIYIILRDEAAVEGASYSLEIPYWMNVLQTWYGPDDASFGFLTPNGVIVGFGECVLGFGGVDVRVAHYQLLSLLNNMHGTISLGPNIDENPTQIEYASCSNQIIECPEVHDLIITTVDVETRSFGAVKSLY